MESSTTEYPIGLYVDKESGQYVGATDPQQANAFVHVGFTLYKEGREAAEMSQKDIDALDKRKKAPAEVSTEQETSPGQAMDASDNAQDAVKRVPNVNAAGGGETKIVISKEEEKKAEAAKKELSGDPQSSAEQIEKGSSKGDK